MLLLPSLPAPTFHLLLPPPAQLYITHKTAAASQLEPLNFCIINISVTSF
jgi:hypothetical protein